MKLYHKLVRWVAVILTTHDVLVVSSSLWRLLPALARLLSLACPPPASLTLSNTHIIFTTLQSDLQALSFGYVVQALLVVRAQFTDRHTWWNWVAIVVLMVLSAAYGSFRFHRGGNLIKIYELPTSGNLQ